MTKEEAKQAMLKGEKVTHRFMGDDEWVKLLDPIKNIYILEDGVKVDAEIYWIDRRSREWELDWEIFKN